MYANEFFRNLYDCLPIEKEKAWANKCDLAHAKVEENFKSLQETYDQINLKVHDIENVRGVEFQQLNEILTKIQNNIQLQQSCMQQLRLDYQFIYDKISFITQSIKTSGKANSFSDELSNSVSELEIRRENQSLLINQLKSFAEESIQLKNIIGDSKNQLISLLYSTLTIIATIQTEIQIKLKKGLSIMKKWYKGHNEYFSHLEHVALLPQSYEQFLLEIKRRNEFHNLFQSKIHNTTLELTLLRNNETIYREDFMRLYGHHLPPIFFDLVPSLKEKPPYFDLKVSEIPNLPTIDFQDFQETKDNQNQTIDMNIIDESITAIVDSGMYVFIIYSQFKF